MMRNNLAIMSSWSKHDTKNFFVKHAFNLVLHIIFYNHHNAAVDFILNFLDEAAHDKTNTSHNKDILI